MANVLDTEKKIAVIGAQAEGSSICSIERMKGIHRDTIMRLQKEGGPIDNLTASNNATLSKCPTRGEGWTQFRERGEPRDSDIKDLLRKLRLLKRIEKTVGCSLSRAREIKEEKRP